MTQAKLKRIDTEKDKKDDNNLDKEKCLKSKRSNDKYIQIAAWVLLTLGLCIIVTTFYLAINQQHIDDIDVDQTDDEKDKSHSDYDDNDDNDEGKIDVEIITKTMSAKILEIGNKTFNGCEEKFCQIICMHANDLYETFYHHMEQSDCNSMDSFIIYKQDFERGIFRNKWIDSERTVKEIALLNSKINIIKSDSFNTPMFSTVFLLYWHNLNLEKVHSGALLGLHSLKYFMIDTKIRCLDRAFFQPVQTTLRFLKIHAGLTLPKEGSFFGLSNLTKLEFADLSRNNIKGSISKKMFLNTPNLKYLYLSKCQITNIREDAFEHLAGKLIILDLSQNMLTTLSCTTLKPLLNANMRFTVNLAINNFICDCNIQKFVEIYKNYRNQFMDVLYCKAPHQLYGKLIDEVNYEIQNCKVDDQPLSDSVDEDDNLETTFEPLATKSTTTALTTQNDVDDTDDSNRNMEMRCWRSSDSIENSEPFSYQLLNGGISANQNSEIVTGSSDESEAISASYSAKNYPIDTLSFDAPDYQFQLQLLENRSVKVQVIDNSYYHINVLWFAEDVEDIKDFSPQVPCSTYQQPHLITEPLIENVTYTFCLIPSGQNEITPFNCLPLHVAPKIEIEDIWIPQDQKDFTIGMLCVLFLMSTFAGAAIAYFGIRAYPDLLEGSKNVLVVKKSDKNCYVSTISEADYMKKSSLKEKTNSNSTLQRSSLPITPISMLQSDSEGITSVQSSSTLFEDAFNPMPYLVDDEYETPKPIDKTEIVYEGQSIPNTYVATSPRRSPPPLPKRNSTANFTDYAY